MKTQQAIGIIILCIYSTINAMNKNPKINPEELLLIAIMKNVVALECATENGITQYTATHKDNDQLRCIRYPSGKIEARYFLYLHAAQDRKKANGQVYEKFDLEGIYDRPQAVLEAIQKKYEERKIGQN